jgi:hypothetical protein
LIRVTAPTSLSLESNFELERIKRSIDAMDDLELLKHLAKQMAEMMHAQKHVTKQLLNPRQRQSFGFEA